MRPTEHQFQNMCIKPVIIIWNETGWNNSNIIGRWNQTGSVLTWEDKGCTVNRKTAGVLIVLIKEMTDIIYYILHTKYVWLSKFGRETDYEKLLEPGQNDPFNTVASLIIFLSLIWVQIICLESTPLADTYCTVHVISDLIQIIHTSLHIWNTIVALKQHMSHRAPILLSAHSLWRVWCVCVCLVVSARWS